MRHRIRKAKLGRTTEHRTSLLANLVSNLIKHRRIRTTLAKAKAARVVADKMVTLSKKGLAADEPKDGLITAALSPRASAANPAIISRRSRAAAAPISVNTGAKMRTWCAS